MIPVKEVKKQTVKPDKPRPTINPFDLTAAYRLLLKAYLRSTENEKKEDVEAPVKTG